MRYIARFVGMVLITPFLAITAGFGMTTPPVQTSAAPDVRSVSASADDGAKQICRTEIEIGTRLGGKRICRTKAEWEAIRAEQRRATERAQQLGSQCQRSGMCGNEGLSSDSLRVQ